VTKLQGDANRAPAVVEVSVAAAVVVAVFVVVDVGVVDDVSASFGCAGKAQTMAIAATIQTAMKKNEDFFIIPFENKNNSFNIRQ
jgi:hypothetical protein